jgi:hypothetical protein
MAGAILGVLHGEAVIDAADRATLDSANRFDLTAAADRFTGIATEILLADRLARDAAQRGRDSLFAAEGAHTRSAARSDLSPEGVVASGRDHATPSPLSLGERSPRSGG